MIKFAVPEESKKIRRKIFFSGFSETAQANFMWALIFWSFFQVEAKRKSACGGQKGLKKIAGRSEAESPRIGESVFAPLC
jgi:hypothetical protein